MQSEKLSFTKFGTYLSKVLSCSFKFECQLQCSTSVKMPVCFSVVFFLNKQINFI